MITDEIFESRKNRIFLTMHCQFLTKQKQCYYNSLIAENIRLNICNTVSNLRHFSYALSDDEVSQACNDIEKNVALHRGKLLSRLNEFVIHYSDRSIQKKYIIAIVNAMNRLSNVTGLYTY